jgi:hypothetical protein
MKNNFIFILCSFFITLSACGPDGAPIDSSDVGAQSADESDVVGGELLWQGRVRARGPFGVRVVQSCPNPGFLDFGPQRKPIDTDFFQVLVYGGTPRRYRPSGPIYKVSDTQTANVELDGNGGVQVSGYRCIVSRWCDPCP